MIRDRVLAGSLVGVFVAGCGSLPSLPSLSLPKTTGPLTVEDLGAGVVKMTQRSGLLVVSGAELKPRVEQEALDYCRGRTGALAVLDSTTSDPGPPGYPSASVVFRCVAP